LWRDLPTDGLEMTTKVNAFRQLYNHVRPHEALAGDRPIERYLADPTDDPIATAQSEESLRIT
ncbi:MAG TPA: hypothetical protein VGG41_04685, partial [Solirubrobacteraceae bacterium]